MNEPCEHCSGFGHVWELDDYPKVDCVACAGTGNEKKLPEAASDSPPKPVNEKDKP